MDKQQAFELALRDAEDEPLENLECAAEILDRLEEVVEEYASPECPHCEGIGAYMGKLGFLTWFRCIDCGWVYSQE